MKLKDTVTALLRRRPRRERRLHEGRLACERLEQRAMLAALPFTFANETGANVQFALYGLDNATGQWTYFQRDSGAGNTFSGRLVPVANLGAGQPLPSYGFSETTATLVVPDTPSGLSSGTIVMTVGDIGPSITVSSSFTVPRPSPSNPSLVNATTNPYYDFIEFTYDANDTLFINTTQVDQLGFPLTLTADPTPAHGAPVGVTPGVSRDAIFEAFSTFLSQSTDPAASDFQPLLQTADTGSPFRIIAPGHHLAIPGNASDPLATYFDTTIQSFFTAPPPMTLIASGSTFVGTATTRNPVASGDLVNGVPHTNPADNRSFQVIEFVAQNGPFAGEQFHIYSPINPPSWVSVPTAGEQVFANNGVFADNTVRASGLRSDILGNLENQVVSALTRGVATLPRPSRYATTTDFWSDPTQAFPEGQRANLYAKFLHTGKVNGSTIFIDGRVYAFPFADQGDQASFFTVTKPTSVAVTLGAWSGASTPIPTPPPPPPAPPPPPTPAAPPALPTTPIGSVLFLLASRGIESTPDSTEQVVTIPSAGGKNFDGTPTNAVTFITHGLTGTYDPTGHTHFAFFLDAGTQAANGTQARISYDFNGDGIFDRVETFRYFATDNSIGWEGYKPGVGLQSATGTFADFRGGSVKIELWNAIGRSDVTMRMGGSPTEGQKSRIRLPFKNLERAGSPTAPPAAPPPVAPPPAPPTAPPPPVAPPPGPGPSAPTTSVGNTHYFLTGGSLSATPGTAALATSIPTAGGRNFDGLPNNALTSVISGLTGTYDPTKQTEFSLFLDAGTSVANGTQFRISYDFAGDGTFDRVETYRYFATDNSIGWEHYTQAHGLASSSGTFASFQSGRVKVEIWNAIGASTVALRTGASLADGQQSLIRLPFNSLTQA